MNALADVLVLATDAYGCGGGIAQYTRDLVEALTQSKRVRRVVILPRWGTAEAELPDKVLQQAAADGGMRYALRCLLLAAGRRFDLVLCGHLHHAPLAYALARRWRAPFWLQLHGLEAWECPTTAAIANAARRADLVTAVSRYTRRRFMEWARIEPQRVRVLPNTVGEQFMPAAPRRELKRVLGLEGRRLLISVSRLDSRERYKGHDRVIAVLPQLLQEFPDLAYLIVGDGDDRGRLEHLAAGLGLSERVRFAGAVAPDRLPDYYRLAEVFAMPSTREGFGIVFLEAAACGLQVVGGNADGSVDALREGAIGWSIVAEDRRQLLLALRSALQAPAADPARVLSFSRQHFTSLAQHHLASLIPA
jgi:phosphatidylinositol alpha-1,6-mannosyltransferase